VALIKADVADMLRQPALQPDRTQLQPSCRDGWQDLHCGSGTRGGHGLEIAPDDVHLPGIYVHRIVHNPTPEKRIEKRTTRDRKV
jgi:3-oxoacid CoA-transferase subunit A